MSTRVKMRTSFSGGLGKGYQAGHVVELDDETAKRLLETGHAVRVDENDEESQSGATFTIHREDTTQATAKSKDAQTAPAYTTKGVRSETEQAPGTPDTVSVKEVESGVK